MIVALIPARGGSKRVPNKNMVIVGERPLIDYSILAAHDTPEIDEVYVSTDSTEIISRGQIVGAKIIIRPDELAQDDSSDYDVVYHALWQIDTPDYIVYLRPTTPMRTPRLLSKIINRVKELDSISSLRTVEEMSESAHKCVRLIGDSQGYLVNIFGEINLEDAGKPNHLMPRTLHPNGYCDILIPGHIERTKKLWGSNVYGFLTPRTIEVDTPEDLEYLRYVMEVKK